MAVEHSSGLETRKMCSQTRKACYRKGSYRMATREMTMVRHTALVLSVVRQEPPHQDRMLHAASHLMCLARSNERHNYHKIPGQELAECRTAGMRDLT